MNRKTSKFEAFQQLADGDNNDDDDAMADGSSAPKSTRPQSQPAHVTQNPVVDDHAGIEEDEEIT